MQKVPFFLRQSLRDRGVPLSPQSPGDIAAPFEIDSRRQFERDISERVRFKNNRRSIRTGLSRGIYEGFEGSMLDLIDIIGISI